MGTQDQTGELARRREDYPLITGRASYVDDVRSAAGRSGALHMLVIRSPYAHAKIQRIELDAARSQAGVYAVLSGAELVAGMPTLDTIPMQGLNKPERRPMAVERVRYMGDPVAVVLAETLYAAEDARDLVEVDYAPLSAVIDPTSALEPGAVLLYEEFGSNKAFSQSSNWGNIEAAFAKADHVIRLRVANQRLAPSSMEPRACRFDFDPQTGELEGWVSSQALFRSQDVLAHFLGIDRKRIILRNASVGGAFGAKNAFLGEEIIAALLAMRYHRPVKWIEQRSENLQAQSQGRGLISDIEAAVRRDGRLLGLRVSSIADLGAFLTFATTMVPTRVSAMLCGPYQVEAIESEVVGVFTNKATTAPYRGAGRPEAAYILERVMERIAQELSLDPVEVRRRNFIAPFAVLYTTVSKLRFDSGNYSAALDRAIELADYDGWRKKQRERRSAQSNKLLGIGLATFIELSGDTFSPATGMPREAATVRIRSDGTILVQCGVAHNGQGHFTAFAQIVANTLQVPPSQVEVQMNDSTLPGFSVGTFGSRITQVAGSAVLLAAEAVKGKALQLAAQRLEVALEDLVLENGQVMVQGVPNRSTSLGELAELVEEQPNLISHDPPNPVNGHPIEGLASWRDFSPSGAAYSSGTHVAVVEIDAATGEVLILTYVAVDDCGRVLNHYLAEAQIHGGLAQGIGQALYEEVLYDHDGQLLSGTLMDYALPIAHQLPNFVTDLIETPSPTNPLGAKGAGEAGCIGGPPAIVNAVLDALSPLGIRTIDMPLRPEKIWELIQSAKAGTLV